MSSQEENDVNMTQSQDSNSSSSPSSPIAENNAEKDKSEKSSKGKKEKPTKEAKRGRGREKKPKIPTVLAAKVNGAVVDEKEKTKVKRGSYDTYVSYLNKLIKKISNDENGFKKPALSSLDLILRNISGQFDQESVRLCRSGKVVTVGIKQMRTVTKLLLPGELMKNAIIRGDQAIVNFNNSKTTKAA